MTLTVWLPPFLSPGPGNESPAAEMLSQRLQEFNQSRPDLQINVRIKAERGPGGLLETMQAATTAAPETLPDLIALDPVGLNTAALKGMIQPLGVELDPPSEESWYPHAIEASQVDGEFYGYPFASDGWILAYRSSSFTNPPLSWNQLIESSRTFLFPAGDSEALFTLIQYEVIGGTLTAEDGRPALNPTTLSSVLASYASAQSAGVLPSDLASYETPQDTWQALLNGRVQSAVSPLSAYFGSDNNTSISASPLPTRDGNGVGISQTWNWAIVTNDPVRQIAVQDLIEWLSAPEFLGPWTQALGYLPPTRAALELWEEDSNAAVATLLASSLRGRPSEENLATFGQPIHEAVIAVLNEDLTPDAAALQAAQRVQNP